jgi:hypothetical protein
MSTKIASPAIHTMFMMPAANSSSMSTQQQPTQ